MALDLKQIKKNSVAAGAVNKTTVHKTETTSVNWLNRDISFGSSFTNTKKQLFYEELSVLMGSGMDIKTSFELLEEEQEKEKDKVLIRRIREDIIAGRSLSQAVQSSGFFSPYEYFSIQIGEETGKTTQVLEDLGLYYQRLIRQRRQLVSALTYPCIVLVTAFGAIFFMLNFMVPMFSEIFKRFKGELPAITKAIIVMSDFLRTFWLLGFLATIAIIMFFVLNRKKEWYRKYYSKMILKIPVVGPIFHKLYLARFCNSMHLLLSSRVDMVRAISMVRLMIDFYPIEKALEEIEPRIINGASLFACLSDYPIFDRRMVYLIKVGEEVNKIDRFLDQLHKQYAEDAEHKSALIGSLIEPVMIVLLGAIVGVILIAMYLPLFQLGSSF
ncbi:MAG: type II secretion system F family protein [Cytophaga sp.]|uniref:type II secretion system F family protein n=1 Tax=Cytophaga sp. TaxID=29535 RepID=UPI003F82061C